MEGNNKLYDLLENKDLILDYGIINQEEIIKFLDKIYKIPFNNPKSWEKEIFDFFGKEVIPIYVASISISNFSDTEIIIKEIINKLSKDVVFLDSGDIYKKLIHIRNSLKTGNNLNNYSEFFYLNNIIIRKMFIKEVDNNDSLFKNYSYGYNITEFYPENLDNKLIRRIYYLLPDSSLDYPFKYYESFINKKINARIKEKFKKNVIKSKRNPLDSKLRHEVFKRDGYKCLECGATNKEKILHCDHIIPISQGGTDEMFNLQTLCDNCNLAKSDKKWEGGLKDDK